MYPEPYSESSNCHMLTLIGNAATGPLVAMTPEDESVPNCPACGTGRLSVRSMLYSVPFFNELAMFMVRCPKCGFSHNDVFSAEQRVPSRFSMRVDDEALLKVSVVRSGSCTFRLPEWGIDVEPGPSADAFISNIEGILFRVRAVVESACRFAELKEEKQRASKILEEMKAAMQGKFPFTLVMEDPAGVSGIFPDDMTLVQYDELTSEEAAKLKGGPVWVDTLREDISERKG